MSEHVKITKSEGILTLVIDRPAKKNALTDAMYEALADALDVVLANLLEDIAATVIGRELELAPVDIAAIVRGATARLEREAIVRIRGHASDATALDGTELKVVPDTRLRRGDAAIDVASGTIDASLGARLETVLARCSR